MKEFKGTPGPWVVEYDNNEFTQWNNVGPACIYYQYNCIGDEYKAKQDSNLISAAPELLETLQQVKNEVGHFLKQQFPELMSEIDYAINKALGVK